MPDNTQVTGTTATTTAITDPVVLVVPEETQKRFPDLVAMILASQSMNNEERNYWMQVLPVMTEAQVGELRDILETEKRKLAEIEAKYAQKPTSAPSVSTEDLARIEEEKRKKREEMAKQEQAARENENPDDILAMLG